MLKVLKMHCQVVDPLRSTMRQAIVQMAGEMAVPEAQQGKPFACVVL